MVTNAVAEVWVTIIHKALLLIGKYMQEFHCPEKNEPVPSLFKVLGTHNFEGKH